MDMCHKGKIDFGITMLCRKYIFAYLYKVADLVQYKIAEKFVDFQFAYVVFEKVSNMYERTLKKADSYYFWKICISVKGNAGVMNLQLIK